MSRCAWFVTIWFMAALPAAAEAPPEALADPPAAEAYARLLPALVDVRVEVLEDPAAAYEPRPPAEAFFDRFAQQHVALRLAGACIAADGTVLVRDPNLPLHRYGKVTVRDSRGRAWRARLAGLLENHAAVLFEPERPLQEGLPRIEFEEASLKPGEPFLLARPYYLEDNLCVRLSREIAYGTAAAGPSSDLQVLWWVGDESGRKLTLSIPTGFAVILDAAAHPIGLALDEALWRTRDGRSSWVGRELIRDRRITRDELDLVTGLIRSWARRHVREIEITFRPDSPLNRQLALEDGRLFAYGLLVDGKGRLLVPSELGAEAVAQIESIAVRDGDEARPAEFEGLFSEMGAFLVRAKEIEGEPPDLSGGGLLRGRIFFTLSPRRRYGERYDKVDYNRFLDMFLGYKERFSPRPQKALRVGDFVLDAEGRLLGFYAPVKPEKRDELHARLERPGPTGPQANRIYFLSELRDVLREPEPHLERGVEPRSRREEKRPLWLGVEYQPLTPQLARALDAEEPTRDGARGLLVTHVYPGSPAERIGVEAGDILLSIAPAPEGREFDLSPRGPWRKVPFASRPADGPPQRLWRPRRNYLTEVLRLLGEGTEIALRRWRAGKLSDLPLRLEKAPDDFDTAEEYRDPVLGLAVKALTYEVRSVLRLAPDAPGVVVSQVQPGGSAALAQVRPFEIILAVNDQPVFGPDDFARLVRESASAGEVELLVTWLGQSRIAKLSLAGEEMRGR